MEQGGSLRLDLASGTLGMEIKALNALGQAVVLRLVSLPDECPRCHRNVQVQFVCSYVALEIQRCQVVFRCTYQRCQELFLASYALQNIGAGPFPTAEIQSVAPLAPQQHDFPESIVALSPSFVEISNQALDAEGHELDQLVGIGLRKALEFLVKDFAIGEHPGKSDAIKAATLSNCINSFIADTNVKLCANRATWLGNDETHYIRKWENKDVQDLKVLVRLTVIWIESVQLTKQYAVDMAPGSSPKPATA